jgi:hypothetical protein
LPPVSENRSDESLTTTEHDKQRLGLPFDQHQRYKIVADVLDRLREDSGALEVLDVGGAEGVILNFLSGDRVTILDQAEVEGVPGFVVGDATALPFEEGSFDYVTSIDVYEHIGAGAREKYLAELRRVARRGVLLAAPFDSEEVRGAEKLANEFHRAIHLQPNVWLEEHEQNGLPDLDWTRAYFEREGDEVSVLPNGYLPHWLAMISLFFYEVRLKGDLRLLLEQLNAFYNESMYEYDNSEPSYRHLVVALKEAPENEGVDLERLTSPSDHPSPAMSSALFATFSTALAPVSELKTLNTQLGQKNRQLTQKDRQLAQRDDQLAEKSRQLTQKDRQLTQKDRQLAERDDQLAEKDVQLAQKDVQLAQKEILIRDLFERLAQQTVTMNTLNTLPGLQQRTATLKAERDQLKRQLDAITGSRGWKVLTKQRELRIALRNSFRGRPNKNDG